MFLPGDVVERIHNGTESTPLGSKNVVECVENSSLYLRGLPHHIFSASNFKLITQQDTLDLGVAFRLRVETTEHHEYSPDGGKTWRAVPTAESLR